jgi:hypothetical protein
MKTNMSTILTFRTSIAESGANVSAARVRSGTERDEGKKERSVLQNKLTTLAIQIGYAGERSRDSGWLSDAGVAIVLISHSLMMSL